MLECRASVERTGFVLNRHGDDDDSVTSPGEAGKWWTGG